MCEPTAQFTGIPTHPLLTEHSEAASYINSHLRRPMDIKVAAMRPSQCLDPRMATGIDLDDILYSGPPTSSTTYSELNYTTCTSPHGYTAATTHPSLLTPASSIASPPRQHKIIDVTVGLPYDASEEIQQLSPASDCSNMFLQQYDMGGTTASPTPTAIHHAPATESTFDMSMPPFLPVSPAAEAPEPSQQQFRLGQFVVSEPQGGDRHYTFPSEAVVPTTAGLQVGPGHYGQRPLPSSMAPNQSSMMENQDAVSLQQQPPRNISPISYHNHQDFHGLPQGLPQLPTTKRERTPAKSRVRKPKRKPEAAGRVAAAAGRSSASGPSSSGSLLSNNSDAAAAGARDSSSPSGKGQLAPAHGVVKPSNKPTLMFKESAPPDLKRLLELRKEFHSDKGRGMWDDITKVYNGEFGTQYGEHDRARLQMKLTRGVNRYGLLPESEKLRIIEAFEHDEKQKYERICARLAEMGGGEVWPWKPAQIEGHLVILGLEEKVVDEKNSLRRKRREAQRKRNAARAMPVSHESVDGIMVEWIGNTRPSVNVNNNTTSTSPVTTTLPSQAHHNHHHHFSNNNNNNMGMRRPSAVFGMAAPQQQQQQQQQQVIVDSHFFSNEDHDDLMKQLEEKYYSNGGDQADMAVVSPATAIGGQQHQHHAHIELPAQFYNPDIKHEQF